MLKRDGAWFLLKIHFLVLTVKYGRRTALPFPREMSVELSQLLKVGDSNISNKKEEVGKIGGLS